MQRCDECLTAIALDGKTNRKATFEQRVNPGEWQPFDVTVWSDGSYVCDAGFYCGLCTHDDIREAKHD
jgi:hypothetical protein